MPRLLAELHQAFTGDSMQESLQAFPGRGLKTRPPQPGMSREPGCKTRVRHILQDVARGSLDPRQPFQHSRNDPVAALAGEGEDVDRRRVDIARQCLSQQRTRPEEPRAHGCGRDAEKVGRFLHRHLLDVAHDEHCPERRGQLIDPAFEQTAQLGAKRRGRRGLGQLVRRSLAAASAPGPSPSNGTTTRSRLRRRSRISDWLMTMRVSQVDTWASPRNVPLCRNACR